MHYLSTTETSGDLGRHVVGRADHAQGIIIIIAW